ncbi:hypothetical protein JCM3765_005440 [Sporobolomyces pararoseus]
MLTSLPPELLHQIIESTVPHTFYPRTYYERQRTLSSLSLVSKRFQVIAQPLLYEIVWIKSLVTLTRYKWTISSCRESDRGVGKAWRPKTAVIGSNHWDRSKQLSEEAMSKEILEWLSSVRLLTWDLNSAPVEGFPSLTGFSDLSSLHLSRVSWTPGNVPSLPQLRSLSMFAVNSPLMGSLLDPQVVPSLKHFSLVDTPGESVRQLKRSRIADLLPQLETLYLHARIWLHPELSFLHSASERTLIDSNSWDWNNSTDSMARIVNLRLMATYLDGTQRQIRNVEEDLKRWVSVLQSTSEPSLRSIYLDSSLRPHSILSPPISTSMDKLVVLCRKRSVELVFDVVPNDFRFDTWISAEFVKRQKTRQNEVE